METSEYVYHGTTQAGVKTLIPKPSEVLGGESAIFATDSYDVAVSFAIPWSDNDFIHGIHEGQMYMEEKVEGNFDRFFKDKPIYIYTLDGKAFQHDDRLGSYEVIASSVQPVIKTDHITDALAALRQTKIELRPFAKPIQRDVVPMDKRQYFIEACQAGCYRRKDWVLSAFSIVRKIPEGELYPYRIIHKEKDDGVYFVDPTNDNAITPIAGASRKEAIYKVSDRIILKPNDMANVDKEVETNYGNALINAIIFVYPFGKKIPFMTGKLKKDVLENLIASKLVQGVKPADGGDPNVIYTDEYCAHSDAVGSLAGFTQISCPAASKETMTIHPSVIKRRDELLLEYSAEQRRDPQIMAKIAKELTDLDRASHKGTKAEGFLIGSKDYDVARWKSLIMIGGEAMIDPSQRPADPITTSLDEGIPLEHMPQIVDSIRQGSYSRGKLTALGGVTVKLLFRLFQNSRVVGEDCGTHSGMQWKVNDRNYKKFAGLYLARLKGSKDEKYDRPLTLEETKGMIGSTILLRSPNGCIAEKPSYCKRCVGDALAANPNSLHTSVSDVGDRFMLTLMKAMHGKALRTARFDFRISMT